MDSAEPPKSRRERRRERRAGGRRLHGPSVVGPVEDRSRNRRRIASPHRERSGPWSTTVALRGMRTIRYSVEHFRNYCTECGWVATTEEHPSRQAVGELAIQHHFERGHDIESLTIEYPALNA